MDDAKFGAACRAVRVRRRMTQAAVAEAAGVRRVEVGRLERGALEDMSLGTVRKVLRALEMWMDITPRWRGPELDRLINGAHAALQGSVLRRLQELLGWIGVPEVSFSIFGERGAIDVMAWHAPTKSLLIIELKTLLVDPAELVRTMDRRVRLGQRIARDRGWSPASISSWVIFTDTRSNRRHAANHRAVLAPLATVDGRRMRSWLNAPGGPVAALSFWPEPAAIITRRVSGPRKRSKTRSDGRQRGESRDTRTDERPSDHSPA
ncbi:MAG: helix-turn-helix transcriptional regulator [Chloroflexi bacterium]|nr:helix-turn-helix transcriptional regulator [Chloroflexota bacterium]